MAKLYKVIGRRTDGVTADLVGHYVEYTRPYPGSLDKIYVRFKTGPYAPRGGGNWWFYRSDLQEVTALNRPEKKKNTLTMDTLNDLYLTYARPNPTDWLIDTAIDIRPRARTPRRIRTEYEADYTIDF